MAFSKKLDRPDMIREIIQGRIPYMLDSFYEKEARISSKKGNFNFKFEDLVKAILLRSSVLTRSGQEAKAEKKPETVKVALTQATSHTPSYGGVVKNSPGRAQPPLPVKKSCVFCYLEHDSLKCNKLTDLSVPERRQEMMKRRLCFKCLSTAHVVKECKMKVECGKCGADHITPLHPEQNSSQLWEVQTAGPTTTTTSTATATSGPGARIMAGTSELEVTTTTTTTIEPTTTKI